MFTFPRLFSGTNVDEKFCLLVLSSKRCYQKNCIVAGSTNVCYVSMVFFSFFFFFPSWVGGEAVSKIRVVPWILNPGRTVRSIIEDILRTDDILHTGSVHTYNKPHDARGMVGGTCKNVTIL